MNPHLRDELTAILIEELAVSQTDALLDRAKAASEPLDAPPLPDWSMHQAVDVSDRAQKMHEIAMIANAHGWQIAITHFLRMKRVAYMSDLTDSQLDDLLDRMHGYVDAAVTGCSLADCLPAS